MKTEERIKRIENTLDELSSKASDREGPGVGSEEAIINAYVIIKELY